MNLVYTDLQNVIELEEGKVNVLVVENPVLLREMILNLMQQIAGNEGQFILSEQGKVLNLAKNAEFIIDLFNIEINKRKVLQKLYEELDKLAYDGNNFLETQELKANIKKYLYELIHTSDLHIEFKEDFAIKEIFSATGIGFVDDGCTILEKIVNFMEVCSKFLKIKILAFVNLSNYLTVNELNLLYKEAAYKKVQLILFERSYKKITDEKLYIIDNDLCEVYCDE